MEVNKKIWVLFCIPLLSSIWASLKILFNKIEATPFIKFYLFQTSLKVVVKNNKKYVWRGVRQSYYLNSVKINLTVFFDDHWREAYSTNAEASINYNFLLQLLK